MHSLKGRTAARLVLAAAVVMLATAAAQPPLILVPVSRPGVETYYQQGQAFAAAGNESTSVLLAASTCEQFGKTYLRVWLMYFSQMNHAVLLDAVHTVGAKVVTNLGYDLLDPAMPYQLLAEAENARTRALIATAIGGALQSVGAAMSSHPTTINSSGTTISGPGGTYNVGGQTSTVNDLDEKVAARTDAIVVQNGRQMDAIRSAHERFAASFNAGALRKHTVFPNSGVNGFIYIPLPANDIVRRRGGIPYLGSKRWEDGDILYILSFHLPGIADTLDFYPSPGE